MKDVDFAIEKGFRLFENGVENFHFFMIQVRLPKKQMADGHYHFELKENEKVVYEKTIIIDSLNQRIITPGSHEDPLVSTHNDYLICFQLWDRDIEEVFSSNANYFLTLSFKHNKEAKLLDNISLGNLAKIFSSLFIQHSHLVSDYVLQTHKACKFRLHIGKENGHYEEQEFDLKAKQTFDFTSYLAYPYLGLQCSYEKERPEVEEKHIVIGQKGMVLSGEYHDEDNIYKSLMPFNNKYQILYIHPSVLICDEKTNGFAQVKVEKWKELKNIDELMIDSEDKTIHFFEMDKNFLTHRYKHERTYGILKTINSNISNKHHIDLTVCSTCKNVAKCMQLVPSGLSQALFKRNILLDKAENCALYQLIEKKDIKL